MFDRAAALAMWRAGEQPDEIQCLRLFGVGPETLQRIESGEVEPEPDVAERIARFLDQSQSLGDGSRMAGPNSTPAPSMQAGSAGVFSGDAR